MSAIPGEDPLSSAAGRATVAPTGAGGTAAAPEAVLPHSGNPRGTGNSQTRAAERSLRSDHAARHARLIRAPPAHGMWRAASRTRATQLCCCTAEAAAASAAAALAASFSSQSLSTVLLLSGATLVIGCTVVICMDAIIGVVCERGLKSLWR